jgi:hypothetical protein
MRHGNAKSSVFPTPLVMGLEQRLTYMPLLALESSRDIRPIDAAVAKEACTAPVAMVEPEQASLPPVQVIDPIPTVPDTTEQHAVDCLGRPHANKLDFRLSPLVFAPESEALAMIDAQFPRNSQDKVSRRNRAITLIGRDLYLDAPLGCSQKEVCLDVISKYEELFIDKGLPKPTLDFSTYSKILAGTYKTRKRRSSN